MWMTSRSISLRMPPLTVIVMVCEGNRLSGSCSKGSAGILKTLSSRQSPIRSRIIRPARDQKPVISGDSDWNVTERIATALLG